MEELTIDFWNNDRWANVVNQVGFTVAHGEAVGLVGESGCGKTTTAYSLLGYRRTNSRIRAGQIFFAGTNLLTLKGLELQRLRGRRIGMVPQNPATALSPGMRVGDQIQETMRVHGIGASRAERGERVFELLQEVLLPDPGTTARKYPHQLSGGQQQRVTIALALCCGPDLLILDEPTTGLDVTTESQILHLLLHLREKTGLAMVYVTHNLGVLSKIADRIVVMYAGELVEDAFADDLFGNPRHPYTRGLIASVPRIATPRLGRSVLLHGVLQRDTLPQGCRFAPRCDFVTPNNFTEPQILTEFATGHYVACCRMHEIPELAERLNAISTERAIVPAPTKEPILSVHQIDISYEFKKVNWLAPKVGIPVVRNVSFAIRPGETYALVGESGSGKSTIARSIAGLVPPSAGQITFQGGGINQPVEMRSPAMRRELQLVLQNPDQSLNPRHRVREIISRPLKFFFKLSGIECIPRVEKLLSEIRLDASYADRYADELSGGERQRIAIARALAAEPKLLLCDEVLSALDVSVQADIVDLLSVLQKEREIAYLFISHDLAIVRSLAHRVGVLYQGQLVEQGRVEEVYSPPYHPYTHMLLSAVPEIGRKTKLLQVSSVNGTPDTKRHSLACSFADRCPWKIGRICEEEVPEWKTVSSTHSLRCHLPITELIERDTFSLSIQSK